MDYYIYTVAECDLSVVTHVASAGSAEAAIEYATKMLKSLESVGRRPYRYVVRYNPTNALVASLP